MTNQNVDLLNLELLSETDLLEVKGGYGDLIIIEDLLDY